MLSTSSKELGTRHQTPTLIGCIFLKTPQNKSDQNLLHFANPAAISEALNSSTVFEELSKLSFFRSVLATPATCSNHLHRAKPCILYRFLTHSEHKTKLSSPTLRAIYSSAQAPPQTALRTWSLLQSGLSSEALDYSTHHTTEQGKPGVWTKNQHSLQTHQSTNNRLNSVCFARQRSSGGVPKHRINSGLPNVA